MDKKVVFSNLSHFNICFEISQIQKEKFSALEIYKASTEDLKEYLLSLYLSSKSISKNNLWKERNSLLKQFQTLFQKKNLHNIRTNVEIKKSSIMKEIPTNLEKIVETKHVAFETISENDTTTLQTKIITEKNLNYAKESNENEFLHSKIKEDVYDTFEIDILTDFDFENDLNKNEIANEIDQEIALLKKENPKDVIFPVFKSLKIIWRKIKETRENVTQSIDVIKEKLLGRSFFFKKNKNPTVKKLVKEEVDRLEKEFTSDGFSDANEIEQIRNQYANDLYEKLFNASKMGLSDIGESQDIDFDANFIAKILKTRKERNDKKKKETLTFLTQTKENKRTLLYLDYDEFNKCSDYSDDIYIPVTFGIDNGNQWKNLKIACWKLAKWNSNISQEQYLYEYNTLRKIAHQQIADRLMSLTIWNQNFIKKLNFWISENDTKSVRIDNKIINTFRTYFNKYEKLSGEIISRDFTCLQRQLSRIPEICLNLHEYVLDTQNYYTRLTCYQKDLEWKFESLKRNLVFETLDCISSSGKTIWNTFKSIWNRLLKVGDNIYQFVKENFSFVFNLGVSGLFLAGPIFRMLASEKDILTNFLISPYNRAYSFFSAVVGKIVCYVASSTIVKSLGISIMNWMKDAFLGFFKYFCVISLKVVGAYSLASLFSSSFDKLSEWTNYDINYISNFIKENYSIITNKDYSFSKMIVELAKKSVKSLIFLGLFIYGWIQYGDLAKIIADYLLCGKDNYKRETLTSILQYPSFNLFNPMEYLQKISVIFAAKTALGVSESLPEVMKWSLNQMLQFVQDLYKRNDIPQVPTTRADQIYQSYDSFVKKFAETKLAANDPQYFSETYLQSERSFVSRFFGEITGLYTSEMETKENIIKETANMGIDVSSYIGSKQETSPIPFDSFQKFYRENNYDNEFVTKAFMKTNEITKDDVNTWPSKILEWTANFLGTITNSSYLPYSTSSLTVQAAWFLPVFLFAIASFDVYRRRGESSVNFSLEVSKIFQTSFSTVTANERTFTILNSPLYLSLSKIGCFESKEEENEDDSKKSPLNNSFKKDSCFQIPQFTFVK